MESESEMSLKCLWAVCHLPTNTGIDQTQVLTCVKLNTRVICSKYTDECVDQGIETQGMQHHLATLWMHFPLQKLYACALQSPRDASRVPLRSWF